MKVFVTGGAGYIGSVTTELLLESGHEAVVFDNFERGHRAAVDPRAGVMEGDLRDKDSVTRAMRIARPDAVVHFAAYALVGESMERPELYFGNNVSGAVNLLESMLGAGVKRLVFSSTCATYGQPEQVPITEDTPQAPTNPYGESKLMVEKLLAWYHDIHGMQTMALRYFNACGATARYGEDHDPETHLIPIVLQVALGQRDKVRIFGQDYDTPDGTCVRDYVHIVDLAQAHILALEGGQSGAVNLGSGTGHSVREVVEVARRVTGRPIPVEAAPRRPGDPATLVAAPGKAGRELGWQPGRVDLSTIMEDAWAWHHAHPNGYAPASAPRDDGA